LLVQGTVGLTFSAAYTTCNTNPMWYAEPASWSSQNSSIATVNSSGTVTGQSGGTTSITGQYTGTVYIMNPMFYCEASSLPGSASATIYVVSVTGPQTVWWFDGQSPSGYTTSITLTATPAGAPAYSWAFAQGSDKASFSGQSGNTIHLSGTKLSTSSGDVLVKVTVNGVTSSNYPITVRGPYKLVAGSKLHSALPGYGYASQIYYTINDNFNALMPSTIAFGEQWTTAVDNRYAGTNWERPPAHGDTTANSQFYDYITGPGVNNIPAPIPTPTEPRAGNTEVQRSGQEWRVGSVTPGVGARVQTDTWHRYVDHGDNDAITSPAP
jgi:hypothetical protein